MIESYIATICSLILIVLVTHSLRTKRLTKRILNYIDDTQVRERQMWDILTVIKQYSESGRVQRKELDIVKDTVINKIEEVPTKIVEVLKNNSDKHKIEDQRTHQ